MYTNFPNFQFCIVGQTDCFLKYSFFIYVVSFIVQNFISESLRLCTFKTHFYFVVFSLCRMHLPSSASLFATYRFKILSRHHANQIFSIVLHRGIYCSFSMIKFMVKYKPGDFNSLIILTLRRLMSYIQGGTGGMCQTSGGCSLC